MQPFTKQYEYTKAIFSGSLLEVYRFENAPKVSVRRKRVPRETNNSGDYPSLERRHDNLRRLRRGFLRLVSTNLRGKGAPSFLTLTFVSDVSICVALECYREFVQRLRQSTKIDVSYISVPEFQKRGTIHFHCLIWGLTGDQVAHERRTRYLQNIWARGYVDIIPTDGSDKLGGYMAKYMSKAMHDERLLGKRAYLTSRNLLRPVLYKTAAITHYTREVLGVDIELLTEKTFPTQWLGEGNYQVFKVIEHD